jgi:hypothetical protein
MAEVKINSPFFSAPTKEQMASDTLMGIKNKNIDYAKYQDQAASGRKYSDFQDLSADGFLKPYMELTKKFNENNLYQDTNKVMLARLEQTVIQLNNIEAQIEAAQYEFTLGVSAIRDSMNLPQLIEGHLGQLQSILNSKDGGKSLFGGFDSNDDPVTDIVNISYLVGDKPTSNYTTTSRERMIYEINGNNQIKYNVLASDEAFVKIIGSYHTALKGDYDKASTMLEEGRNLLRQRITEVKNNASLIEDSDALLQSQQRTLQEDYNTIFSANQNEAATMATVTLDSIKNSQWVMAKILGLSLMDALRDL